MLGAAVLGLGVCACLGESNSVLPGEAGGSTETPPTGSSGTGGVSNVGGASETPSGGAAGAAASSGGRGGTEQEPSGDGASSEGGSTGAGTGGNGDGGSDAAGGSSGALAGNGGAGGAEPSTGCAPRTSFMLAVKTTIPLSWPETTGTLAGTGEFVLGSLTHMTADGNAWTGEGAPCLSMVPPYTYKELVGGGTGRLDIPDSVWDTPGFPHFATAATISGWDPGSSLDLPAAISLVGLSMADPAATWPDSYTSIQVADHDDDGKPGITAIPATGDGFAQPPVSIFGPKADRLYIVARRAVTLSGHFTSCTELEGTATIAYFDNHVVGCRTVNGSACNSTQTDFVDSNRTIYDHTPGTFKAVLLPDGATCADVRAMP